MSDPHPGTLAPLALCVLELLHEQPRHPYEMQQVLRSRNTGRFVKIRAGSLYHTVERLHTLDLIEPVETERAGRRPERTIYAITADGRQEFLDNIRGHLRHPALEYPVFGATIQMLKALDPQEGVAMLTYRVVGLETEIAGLEQAVASLTKLGHPRIHIVEAEYAIAMRTAELTWVQNLVSDIQTGRLIWPTDSE